VVYIGAENSIGFHNPTEAQRNLGDAVAFAGKAEGLLRQALAKAGIDTPVTVNLELEKYLDGRARRSSPSTRRRSSRTPTASRNGSKTCGQCRVQDRREWRAW